MWEVFKNSQENIKSLPLEIGLRLGAIIQRELNFSKTFSSTLAPASAKDACPNTPAPAPAPVDQYGSGALLRISVERWGEHFLKRVGYGDIPNFNSKLYPLRAVYFWQVSQFVPWIYPHLPPGAAVKTE